MKRIVLLLLTGIVVVFVFLGIQASIERGRTTVKTIESYHEEKGIPVTTAQAELKSLKSALSYTGSIRGIEQADISASVQLEKVLNIHVSPGQMVKQDKILITLDNRTTAAYIQIREALEDAKRDHERITKLFKAGAVSKQSLDKAELGVKSAQAEFDALMVRHRVTSPISGTVTDVFVEKGQTVTAGLPLVRVAQLHKVEIELNISETDISSVREGQKAIVRTRSLPGIEFEGKVSEVALSTNPQTRTFSVKVELDNSNKSLKPGMFTEVDLVVGEAGEVVSVPSDAVVKENGSYYVYVVRGNSTVEKINVNPGIIERGWTEIPIGIQTEDVVVVEGHNKLSAGDKINAVS